MRQTLRRILKHGTLAALVLAVLGYVMAEVAGMYLATLRSDRSDVDPEWANAIASDLRRRMPFGMAVWGFGLVAVFEFLGWLVRGTPPPPAAKPPDSAAELWMHIERVVESGPVPPKS